MEKAKIIEELHMMKSYMRAFCEDFDCEDVDCGECPVGPELCLALGKRNLELKYPTSRLERVIYWLRYGWF